MSLRPLAGGFDGSIKTGNSTTGMSAVTPHETADGFKMTTGLSVAIISSSIQAGSNLQTIVHGVCVTVCGNSNGLNYHRKEGAEEVHGGTNSAQPAPREKRLLALLIGLFDLHEATIRWLATSSSLCISRLPAAGQKTTHRHDLHATTTALQNKKKIYTRRESFAAYSRPVVAAYASPDRCGERLISWLLFPTPWH